MKTFTQIGRDKDEVYLRTGDETRKLNFQQRQELTYDQGQAVFEASPVPGATMEDLDHHLLGSYTEALKHPDVQRLLRARSLVTKRNEITAAAMLLFGQEPERYFPEAYVRIVQYAGRERGAGRTQQLIRDVRLEGGIPNVLKRAQESVRLLQPTRRALGREGRFEAVPVIPEDAWLEGLVNAVIHRSYSLGGDHIRVEIFDDRIEIESPGRFPGLISLKDPLNAARFARNPRIARVCSDLSFGQELGEGIRRIFQEMRRAGLTDPLYRQTSGSVRLSLLAAAIDRAVADRLPKGAQELLALLRKEGPLGTGEVIDLVGVSRLAVLRRLYALQEAGLIEWSGKSLKDPRALWSAH